MFILRNIRTVHVALGAALITLIAGCSDAPSGLRRPLPGSPELERPVTAVADLPLLDATVLQPRIGEHRQRRSLRGADGQVLVVESVVGVDGRPRGSVITRNGAFLMRINNEWAPGAPGRLDHQQMFVRGADGGMRSFDSRDVSPAELATAREKLRSEAAQMTRQPTGRIRRLEEDGAACDAEARAAEVATWQYVTAALAMFGASATGNVFAALPAFGAFVAATNNLNAKQADLDACVERAGKKPVFDEY